jgi:hypothetical protein
VNTDMNERDVENQTGKDENESVQILKLGFIDNWCNDQVHRDDENQIRNDNWALKVKEKKI